ncbi:amino acid transporter [Aureobasidium pullulans]|nr:amino acid transporter [Aureobasidium pullulans]
MSTKDEKTLEYGEKPPTGSTEPRQSLENGVGEIIHTVNASGHRDQLQRHYGPLQICGLALNIDSAWVAFAGSLILSLPNGGPAGVLYELITACIYYGIIAASIAELASAVPTAGGVYHWASVTAGPRWGRSIGFFAGFLNFAGWIFDLCSIIAIPSNVVLQMYSLFNPDFVLEAWHTYLTYVLITWFCVLFCIFGNRFLPLLQNVGLFLLIVGGVVSIIVLAATPKTHASSTFVWSDWQNTTGWGGGVAFLTGVLNGSFTIATVDSVSHMAEELPNPRRDIPRAIFAQVSLGAITAFLYAIALFYAVSDLDEVINTTGSFPVAVIYHQATGNAGGAFCLLLIVFLIIMICAISTTLSLGRTWWALARDQATPFGNFFSSVNENLSCPIPATILVGILVTGLGAIILASGTAFNDLVGSFIVLCAFSYFLAIFPHLITGRKYTPKGSFWMGKWGFGVNALGCVLIVFFNIMFCFPYAMPVSPDLMNYNSVILAGVLIIVTFWWLIYGLKHYPTPKVLTEAMK